MSTKEKINGLTKTLRLDSHHAMERFGVITAFFAVTLVVLVASIAVSVTNNHRAEASATALYTPTFTSSKTSMKGNVNGVFVSEDRTRALVYMQFAGTNLAAMSTSADNYQAFMTGSTSTLTQETLASNIDGQVVVFGSTGYMGLLLDSDEPFNPQILQITMRANAELAHAQGDESSLRADMQGDQSFLDHDQWRIYVNPGAAGATELPALGVSGEPVSWRDVYYSLQLEESEIQARSALDEALSAMRVDLAKMDEYADQAAKTSVGGVKLIPAKAPAAIASDSVIGSLGSDDDPLTLHTRWVPDSGYNFDWRSGSISSGYLDDLIPNGMTMTSFLSEKSVNPRSETRFNARDLEWMLTDGTNLNEIERGVSQAMAPLTGIMNNFTQVYQNYYNQKMTYHTTLHEALISLEVELGNVEEAITINDTEDALFTY